MRAHSPLARRAQRGFSLVEALVAILVFSIGVVAMVGVQGTAVRLSTDAQQRAEAAFLADQLFARMLISDAATGASFSHRASGSVTCAPTGASSSNASVQEWLDDVTATFPRAVATEQQIVVTGTPADQVTVRLCWRNHEGDTPHVLEVTNKVQWQ